jgi:hypothetical protein
MSRVIACAVKIRDPDGDMRVVRRAQPTTGDNG